MKKLMSLFIIIQQNTIVLWIKVTIITFIQMSYKTIKHVYFKDGLNL